MKTSHLMLCLIAALALVWPTHAAQGGAGVRRFALVVGANNGGQTRVQLSYATTDAAAFAAVIGDLGGVGDGDLVVLMDPDRDDVERGFQELSARVAEAGGGAARTEVIFYYSGHSDEQGLRLGEGLYAYADLKEDLFAVPSDVRLAILDSCASGTLTRVKGGSFQPPFLVDDANQVKGYAILTSSSADEAAQESDRLEASFFTHSLISGLRGAADTTGDSRVTLNEVYQFAFNDTLARTEKTQAGAQHPAYDIQLAGTGDLVLTDLRETSAILVLDPTLDGRVYVRDAAGRLVVELRKMTGQQMELALEPGQYTVTVQVDGALKEGQVTLVEGDRTPLKSETMSPVDAEQVALRGDTTVTINIGMAPEAAETPPARAPCPKAHKAQLNVLNHAEAIDGTQIALVANRVGCDMKGFQVAIGLNSVGRDVDGLQVAAGPNLVTGDVKGAQATAAFNIAWGDVQGVQGAAGFNAAKGAAMGLQAAGGFNLAGPGQSHSQVSGGFNVAAGSIAGVQGAGGFNVTSGDTRGLQAAGGFNVTGGDYHGLQAAGGFNVAGGHFEGVQASGGFQRVGSLDGLQVSVINIAGDVKGAQVGVINIARDVEGLQLGVINIARSVDGLPLGLLSVVKDGERHLSVWTDDMGNLSAGFSLGNDRFYTQFAGSASAVAKGTYLYGLGFGFHLGMRKWWVDPIVATYQVYDPAVGWGALNSLNQAQVLIGRTFFRHLGLFVGPTFNVHVTQGDANKTDLANIPSYCPCKDDDTTGTRVRMWPGFVLGVRI